jgi:16S rRNA processing protein RimM
MMQAAGAGAGHGGDAPGRLVVGHIAKAHGTRGELFVWPLTDRPEEVFADRAELLLGDEEGGLEGEFGTVVIERARPFKRGLLVKLAGLDDRNAVEPLARRYLLAPFDRLEPLDEGEVFYHQLLGLEVVTVEGDRVGQVREVYETEPAHLLEVAGEGGKLHLIPFSEQVVRRIDVEAGRMVIKPPPGLLSL